MKRLIHWFKRGMFWLQWPALYLYFRKSQRSRILLRNGDTILLIKGSWKRWYDDDGFGIPGGGIDRRESPAEGAVRELREELGVRVEAHELRFLGESLVHEYGLHYHAHFFVLNLSESSTLRLQKNEIAEICWVPMDTARAMRLKPEVHRALELSRNR